MKSVRVEDAVGMVLGHDLTEIVPGKFKGVAFKKGHIIKESDIEKLLRIGKEHIYVLELDENTLHEDDAAIMIGDLVCGEGTYYTLPKEGKINIMSKYRGLLRIDKEILYEINSLGDMILATIHGNRIIEGDSLIGGFRIIPLTMEKERLAQAESILREKGPIFNIKPFKKLKVSLIITGSEVYKGRIEDKFGPVIEAKVKDFDSEIIYKVIVPDEQERIKEEIIKSKEKGAELIIVTGGMSVDPDDKTPRAIKSTGANIITYGTPVLPGAMLLLSYLDHIPLIGLPGCAMFSRITSLDLILPRIFAGERISREDIINMGYGGQCLSCKVCSYPDCHLGKY